MILFSDLHEEIHWWKFKEKGHFEGFYEKLPHWRKVEIVPLLVKQKMLQEMAQKTPVLIVFWSMRICQTITKRRDWFQCKDTKLERSFPPTIQWLGHPAKKFWICPRFDRQAKRKRHPGIEKRNNGSEVLHWKPLLSNSKLIMSFTIFA